jgi:hypothetical protein
MTQELVFYCQMLNDIYDCDNIGIVASHSEVNIFLSLGEILVLFHLKNIHISRASV